MAEFLRKHQKWVIIGAIVFVVVMLVVGGVDNLKQRRAEAQRQQEELGKELEGDENTGTYTSDSALMQRQPDLIAKYGKLPEGYIWDVDGTLLSLGDKSMTAEEVVYAYFNGIKTLDFSSAQRFSRKSKVIATYSGYFDEKNPNTDYKDNFLRNMYKQCLLSIRINGIESNVLFVENKQVFTVNASILDLTSKDFWEKDKEQIYRDLMIYRKDQGDSTKADIYLYDYISSYYKSKDAKMRDVTFDITVQKFPDLYTGWLVSIDTDVDLTCKYSEGTLVLNYIKEQFSSEGRDYLEAIELGKIDGTSGGEDDGQAVDNQDNSENPDNENLENGTPEEGNTGTTGGE